jgi:hypothetical protein
MERCKTCGHPTYKLDDWVDGVPDAWDYEAVLREQMVDVSVNMGSCNGFSLVWRQGCMHIPTNNPIHAKKAAALFVELWLRGVSASFADKLMDGYLSHLEAQDR